MKSVHQPPPHCPCGCASEVQRVLGLLEVIAQELKNDADRSLDPGYRRALEQQRRARLTVVR